MKKVLLFLMVMFFLASCRPNQKSDSVRPMADTVGFASKAYQIDSVMQRIERLQGTLLSNAPRVSNSRLVICPHDDYTYVGWLYPATLRSITAHTVVIFGVAHKARRFGLEDKLIFDTFSKWHGPYGDIKVSELRDEIFERMPSEMAIHHDSMHMVEHSVESMLPFLQQQNRNVKIVSILVPYMDLGRMGRTAKVLAGAIATVLQEKGLEWGKDVALLVTTDAVHYGDEDWGDKNYAPFGTDSAGYSKAVQLESEILVSALTGSLTPEKVELFTHFTLDPNNYKEYKWTWCGRYSIPVGLLTALELNRIMDDEPLTGLTVGYATSIDHEPIPVEDLGMGKTAPANLHHWVGYAAVVYP